MSNGLTKEEKKARNTEWQRKWRAKNPNYYRNYFSRHRDRQKIADRKFYIANHEERKSNTRAWESANQEKVSAYRIEYYAINREKKLAASREWHIKNAKKVSERKRAWNQSYPEKAREISARRHARKINAMPKWLTKVELANIKIIYAQAVHARMTVDHIVPLQGRLVCGLHVPWNLQLLPFLDNVRKSNRFDV